MKTKPPKRTTVVTKPVVVKAALLRDSTPPSFSDRSIVVDKENGVIKNVAILTCGPALGHGFSIDQLTIAQFVALANEQPDGVKCRFRHPEVVERPDGAGGIIQSIGDSTGTQVGRIKNMRVAMDGSQARGDIYLGTYAQNVPGDGDLWTYLLNHADEDPTAIGMSAMFTYTTDPETDDYGAVIDNPARIDSLSAVDFVSEPAANPNGLLSAKPIAPPATPPVAPQVQPSDIPAPYSAYLKAMFTDGPLTLAGLATRFSGRLEAMRANADWLVSQGYADRTAHGWKATPKGVAQAALQWSRA